MLEQYLNDTLHHVFTLGHDVITQFDTAAATGSSAAARHLLYDIHGSTRAILDAAAAITQQYGYTAYGNQLTGTNLTAAAAALTRLLYSGEFTGTNGTQYLRARWYNPGTGTFNRLDPFAGLRSKPLSLHKYIYGVNNPVGNIDPSGKLSLVEISLVSATISALFSTGRKRCQEP